MTRSLLHVVCGMLGSIRWALHAKILIDRWIPVLVWHLLLDLPPLFHSGRGESAVGVIASNLKSAVVQKQI